MKRKTIILTFSLLSFSIISIIILYLFSDKLNHGYNSFIRLFPPHPVLLSKTLDIQYNSYYIAGTDADHIYLGNSTAPLLLLITNKSLTDTQHAQLTINSLEKLKLISIKVTVDSPDFYITDGIMPGIFKGTVADRYARRYMYDSAYFTEAVPVSPSSFALRIVSQSREYVLAKETKYQPHFKPVSGLLEKQVDGLFCTDGMLHYNKDLAMLVYVYHYRNQFICMDSSLNLLYRGKTIDTISHAKIKVAEIKSENAITLAAPPLMVNSGSCVSGNWLFVHSKLLAKNENKKIFDSSSVIDVYNLTDGSYKFSLYLLDHEGKKMKEFQVSGNKLIALYDHYILTYNLNPEYFLHNKQGVGKEKI